MRGVGEHITRGSLEEDARQTRYYLAEAFRNAGFTDRDRFDPSMLRVLTNMRDREWVYTYKNLVLLKKLLVKGTFGYEVHYEMPVGERAEEKEVKRFEERKFDTPSDPFHPIVDPAESVG